MASNGRASERRRDSVAAVAALSEPSRRALYDYVVGRRDWVSREEAAAAVGLARGITSHHLDRLAEEGLLDVDFRRLNERRGPGAGRPAKVYRRALSAEITVSLPPRDYELAGRLLVEAAVQSQRDGTPIALAIAQAARSEGARIAAEARARIGRRSNTAGRREQLFEALDAHGFEPEVRDEGVVVLHNCPFHELAQTHTELICGMNLCMLDSLLSELGDTELRAYLDPEDGRCCVRLDMTAARAGDEPLCG
jgi:predicted ArsR family transcriptional regulator